MTTETVELDNTPKELYQRWWDEASKLCWLLLPEARADLDPDDPDQALSDEEFVSEYSLGGMWDVLSVEDRSRFPADQRDVLERMDVIDAAIEAAGGLLTLNRR